MSIVETPVVEATVDELVRAVADRGQRVDVVETAMSWVLLTDHHAFKVKKTIDFGDAQYRSPSRRRQACTDEIWLNRRLAPKAYLGVVSLVRNESDELRLGGKGTPVDWAVKMRRLCGERSLTSLLAHGEDVSLPLTALGGMLAEFYTAAPPALSSLDDFLARLERRLLDREILSNPWPPRILRMLKHVRAAQRNYLAGAHTILALRLCDGRVVEGHGDLRPEHVFFDRQPTVIDCAEYSAECRQADALDDLSSLAVDLMILGHASAVEVLMAAYRTRAHDEEYRHLEAFYRSLHDCARAKALVAEQVLGGRSLGSAVWAQAEQRVGQAARDVQQIG